MARPSQIPAFRAARSASRRSIGVVLTVVLALAGAPGLSAVRNECNVCPRTCPMHHREEAPAQTGPRLKCHGAAGDDHRNAAAHDGAGTTRRGPTLARPACGNHGLLPGTALPPMILPVALARAFVPVVHPARPADQRLLGRRADPPDTPPPIAAA